MAVFSKKFKGVMFSICVLHQERCACTQSVQSVQKGARSLLLRWFSSHEPFVVFGFLFWTVVNDCSIGSQPEDAELMISARVDIRKFAQFLQAQQINPTKIICSESAMQSWCPFANLVRVCVCVCVCVCVTIKGKCQTIIIKLAVHCSVVMWSH